MIEVNWFFGPDGVPFVLGDDNVVRAETGNPFHGVIGLGMKESLESRGADPGLWLENAHWLFSGTPSGATDPLTDLRRLAERTETLSFAESVRCVNLYLTRYVPERGKGSRIDAWNVKEGHISSVWKVSIPADDRVQQEFALNVGRDRRGSLKLRASSAALRKLSEARPDIPIAAVLDVRTITLGQRKVVVTRNEWVADAMEIHVLDSADLTRYVLVERFLTDELLPAQIVGVYGRYASSDECQAIGTAIRRFTESSSTMEGKKSTLDLKRGDLVWDGNRAVVVAAS